MKNVLPRLAIAVWLAFVAVPAFAYGYKSCLGKPIKWSSNTQTMRPWTVSFPPGYWEAGARQTINWFDINASRFRYTTTIDTGIVDLGNGQNEMWFTSGSSIGGAVARAEQRWHCYWLFGNHVSMKEVDVRFNADYSFTADLYSKAQLSGYGGFKYSLMAVGAHELGHGLILNHENRKYNVMGDAQEHIQVNGTLPASYLGEDATEGAIFLYGAYSAHDDLSVVHHKYSFASGEYSEHARTVVYNSAGSVLPAITINGESGHVVTRGQRVLVEFTYENNGANTKFNIPVGYYISNNDLISTSDRKIGSRTMVIGNTSLSTQTFDVTIPADLVPGNYWIGVIIDDTNAIPESLETNNATYIPVRVQ